eukprot:scaffold49003_cov60-Attheya_sp.AAC.4
MEMRPGKGNKWRTIIIILYYVAYAYHADRVPYFHCSSIVHFPQPWFAGRYVAVSDQKCQETAPAPYHICSATFTKYSRKFGGPYRYIFCR